MSRTVAEKLARRALFGGATPLRRFGLLDLASDPNTPAPPLLAHIVVPGEQVVDLLTGQRGPGRRLFPFARTIRPTAGGSESVPLPRPSGIPWSPWRRRTGRSGCSSAAAGTAPDRWPRRSPPNSASPLLVIDLARLAASGLADTDQASLLALVFSTARLQKAILYLERRRRRGRGRLAGCRAAARAGTGRPYRRRRSGRATRPGDRRAASRRGARDPPGPAGLRRAPPGLAGRHRGPGLPRLPGRCRRPGHVVPSRS